MGGSTSRGSSGPIRCLPVFKPKGAPGVHPPNEECVLTIHCSHSLLVWEAKNLPFSDTYAVATANSVEIGRTGVIWQNSSPYYQTDINSRIERGLSEVKIQVYGLVRSRTEPVGSVTVSLADPPEGSSSSFSSNLSHPRHQLLSGSP